MARDLRADLQAISDIADKVSGTVVGNPVEPCCLELCFQIESLITRWAMSDPADPRIRRFFELVLSKYSPTLDLTSKNDRKLRKTVWKELCLPLSGGATPMPKEVKVYFDLLCLTIEEAANKILEEAGPPPPPVEPAGRAVTVKGAGVQLVFSKDRPV